MKRLRQSRLVDAVVQRIGVAKALVPFRVAELPLRAIVRGVVSRLPRDPSLLVFGSSSDRFADNPAYLFLHLSKTSPSLRCVWITGSPDIVRRVRAAGYAAELRWTLPGVLACVRAGWFVVGEYVSDINRWLHDGATLFNVWHGLPLKATERDIKTGPLAFMFREAWPWSVMFTLFKDERRPPDVLLSGSEFISRRCWVSAFGVEADACLNVGYPRDDHFFVESGAPPSETLVADRALWDRVRANPFVVGYFPTWRDDSSSIIGPGRLSLSRLASVVGGRGGLLLFKPHFDQALETPDAEALVMLDRNDDLNAYLHLCSVLVTDYSAVAFDFLHLGRPILYYVPDLDDYTGTRGLYFTPAEMMPGPLLKTPDELYAALAILGTNEPADPRAAALRTRLWDGYDGHAAARIQAFLEEAVGRDPRRSSGGVTTRG